MLHFKYPALFKKDNKDGGFVITFRDIPEAITQAESLDACFNESVDCLEEAIAGRIDDGLDIPTPSKARRHECMISTPAQTAIKAALYIAMKEEKINKSELARRLDIDVREVRRMLNPHHGTKLPSMEQALTLLGRSIELHIGTGNSI